MAPVISLQAYRERRLVERATLTFEQSKRVLVRAQLAAALFRLRKDIRSRDRSAATGVRA